MSLQTVSPTQIDALMNQAVSRLTLFVMGQSHAILGVFSDWLSTKVMNAADGEGMVGIAELRGLETLAREELKRALTKWTTMLEAALEQAGDIAFAGLVVRHNSYFTGATLTEASSTSSDTERLASLSSQWQNRRNLALKQAKQRTYGDGLNLSQRIWRLEHGGMDRIKRMLAEAYSERTSAAKLARTLEAELGVDKDMPRWTEDRLYRMTARQRATSKEGLLRGSENRTQGLAYNALRLARTEIQYANIAVGRDIAINAPWVTGRKVTLSPGHPKIDVCDDLVSRNPYPKDSEVIPAHSNCMCYFSDVLMNKSAFIADVKGWMKGDNHFLDDYKAWMGGRQVTEPLPWSGLTLADALELWNSNRQAAQALALKVS